MSSPRLGDESLPKPNEAQQRVMDRIAVQRERLDARRVQRARQEAVLPAQTRTNVSASLLMQAVELGKQYPIAVVALAGVAMVAAGPRRVIRFLGVMVPLVMRLRAR